MCGWGHWRWQSPTCVGMVMRSIWPRFSMEGFSSVVFAVDLSVPPTRVEVVVSPSELRVSEGMEATFDCRLEGEAHSRLVWSHLPQVIITSNMEVMQFRGLLVHLLLCLGVCAVWVLLSVVLVGSLTGFFCNLYSVRLCSISVQKYCCLITHTFDFWCS